LYVCIINRRRDIFFSLQDIYLIAIYITIVGPSLLLAKETKTRLLNLKSGYKALIFLPLTVSVLISYVFFAIDFLSKIPILNLSWLGHNIAIGPFADQGAFGILPFIPLLLYMLIHVNYFEEFYFRKNVKRVIIWALLHIVMGVAVYVVIILFPLGLFYRYILYKYSINHAYTLHFATNLVLIGISVSSYFLL
jgi:membrane protease YdiL (CAAX protease family)